MGGLSITHLLIVVVIVALVFGTSRLRNVGKDLGGAIKGFKEGMRDEENTAPSKQVENQQGGHTIEGEVKDKTQTKG